MAHTTQINDAWLRPYFTRDMPRAWFGYQVPERVTRIEVYRDSEWNELRVRWKVKDDDAIHSMPFEQTDEAVQAVLTAMKLTC